jgi:hypothetical protein
MIISGRDAICRHARESTIDTHTCVDSISTLLLLLLIILYLKRRESNYKVIITLFSLKIERHNNGTQIQFSPSLSLLSIITTYSGKRENYNLSPNDGEDVSPSQECILC